MNNNKILLAGSVLTIALIAFLFWPAKNTNSDGNLEVVMYKDPNCGCCVEWAKHMNENGFRVKEENTIPSLMGRIKGSVGVTQQTASCHTAIVGEYFVEGHVPAREVKRLLEEKPDALGLTVPGMPIGSPGMEGPNPEPYDVYLVGKDGSLSIYASY